VVVRAGAAWGSAWCVREPGVGGVRVRAGVRIQCVRVRIERRAAAPLRAAAAYAGR